MCIRDRFRNLGSTTLIELDALCQKYHVKINSLSSVKESLQQFNFPSKLYIYLFRNNIHHINDFNDKTVYDLYCICLLYTSSRQAGTTVYIPVAQILHGILNDSLSEFRI